MARNIFGNPNTPKSNPRHDHGNLLKFLDHEFSSGPYNGEDYIEFAGHFFDSVRALLPAGADIKALHNNHYCASVVITRNGKLAYLSIPDVRYYPNEWYTKVLVRTMKHENDWCGGPNRYTGLLNITDQLDKLLA